MTETGLMETTPIRPCPECAQGKCRNCNGTAWDQVKDEPAACPCKAADHPRSVEKV